MKPRASITLPTILILALSVGSASAYTRMTCGGQPASPSSARIELRLHEGFGGTGPDSGDPNPENWRSAFVDSMQRWTATSSNVEFVVGADAEFPRLRNGTSEVYWTNISAPAQAVTFFDRNCRVTEVDVQFNPMTAFTTSRSKSDLWRYSSDGERAFQNTALHELGHVVGLGHTTDRYSIMGEDWTHVHVNGSATNPQVGEDAVRGAIDIHGFDNIDPEYSVAHWRRTGSNGGYSVHERTRMFSGDFSTGATGAELPQVTFDPEPVYQTRWFHRPVTCFGFWCLIGTPLQAEFTLETTTLAWRTVPVRVVLSTNDYITTLDQTLLDTEVFLWMDGQPETRTFQFYLPGGLNPGQRYWIGLIVDPERTYGDRDYTNNATYIGIQYE